MTTRHSASLYPWQVGSALPDEGPVIGVDLLAGRSTFHYDPWALYARRLLTSPNMVVLGQLGTGKSSLVKTHLHRQLLAGRQAYVLDPKGEYTALAQLHDLPLLRLGPGSSHRLNPLDAYPGDTPTDTHRRRAETVTALAATGLGRDLTPEERAAVAGSLHDLPADALLGHLTARLLDPAADLASSLSTTPATLATAVRPVALELRRMLDGDLAGLFDAPSSHRLDPHGPGLVLDLSALFDSAALPTVMVAAGAWLARTLTPNHNSQQATSSDGASGGRQRLLLVDEAWAVLHLPATTGWLQSLSKLARAHGVQLITVVHRASDLTGQADAGTATQARARGLLADAETRVLYTQTAGERTVLRDLLDLSDVEADLLTQLPPHRALWQIGRHRAVVDHRVSHLEARRLIDTDQQMRRQHPPEALAQDDDTNTDNSTDTDTDIGGGTRRSTPSPSPARVAS
ncbi:MAG: ATP/GTP-binding protein [Frankiales bacterium]|nr:ATP/GTP-binding protein [Frankiales bacterium]